jgi:hypothetical protein
MLVACESVMSKCKSEYLSSIITNIQIHLKILFNTFIDIEISWINDMKITSKRCGILIPFSKISAFIDRIESVVRGVRSQAADTTYHKLIFAMFKWLDTIALSDPKYTDVVYMENYHIFWYIFTHRNIPVPALEAAVSKAEIQYKLHLSSYVEWNIQYEMSIILKFWNKLEDTLKTLNYEDIPFTHELSKHDLRVITKNYLQPKILQKNILNMFKRIQKHMPKNVNKKNYKKLFK